MRRVSATEKVAGLTIATWAARMDVHCTGVSHLYIYGRTGGCCHKVLACLYPDCRISRKAGVKINKLVLLSCTILPMSVCYIQKIVSSLELECCSAAATTTLIYFYWVDRQTSVGVNIWNVRMSVCLMMRLRWHAQAILPLVEFCGV